MLLIKKKVLSNSPFRYPGGKFYARKIILNKIPNLSKYCEPFVGGGSIFFAKKKCTQNIINDKDKELTNCYKVIQNNLEQLIKKLKNIKATRELHSYYKNEYVPQNNIERAFKYYYLNRTSYSGIMKPQNCYWGYGDKYSMRPENWANHLINVSEKLQKVKILNLDFEDLFNKLDDDYFLFIDPPYFNADQDKFYNEIFTKEDHLRLVKVLKKIKINLNSYLPTIIAKRSKNYIHGQKILQKKLGIILLVELTIKKTIKNYPMVIKVREKKEKSYLFLIIRQLKNN